MAPQESINQLVIVTAASETLGELSQRLVHAGFYFTLTANSGDLLQKESVTLLIGINHSRRDELMSLVEQACQRKRTYIPARMEPALYQNQPVMIEAEVGGAVVSSLEVERFEQF